MVRPGETLFLYTDGVNEAMNAEGDVYSNEALLAFSLNGYSATPENVRTGDYPLGTKGYVVIRSDEPEDSPARRLYNWFGSPLSDTFLTSCGITPLSE